jgi:hypothetical protein
MSLFFYKVIQKWFQVGSMCLFFVLYVLNVLSLLFGRPKMAYNVLQIGDGRAFQHKSWFGELNFLLPQNCQAETKPRLLPMCCYTLLFCPFFIFCLCDVVTNFQTWCYKLNNINVVLHFRFTKS